MIRIICFHQGEPISREFEAEQVVIGSGGEGAVVDLDLRYDTAVSPRHARLWITDEEAWIEDCESARGTQINGQEIRGEGPRRLQRGDTVKIGATILIVQVTTEKTGHSVNEAQSYLEAITPSLDANLPPFENARDTVTDTERRLALFYELPLQFGRETRLNALLNLIIEQLVNLIPGARRGAVLVKDQSTQRLALRAHVPANAPAASLTLAQQAMEMQRAFIWPAPPHRGENNLARLGTVPESLEEYGIESAMYAPLLWQGAALGAVCVDNDEMGDVFTTDDLRLVQAVAHHAAMALANLQLQEGWQRQTEFLNRLLLLVSPQIAGLLERRRGRLRLGGEFHNATILVSDVRGFTNLSATMSLDDVTEMLDDYFGRLVPIIFEYQGTIDKFVGDGILAVFGSPGEDKQQHLHAVQAAIEMQSAMRDVNARRVAKNKHTGELGIGIHCGEIVHGLIGTSERMEFTVIGDTVNRASRYCDGALGGEVLFSPEVHQWVWKHVSAEQTSVTTKHEGDLIAYRLKQLKVANK